MWGMLLVTGWLLAGSVMDIGKRRVPVWMLALGGVLCVPVTIGQWGGYPDVLQGMLPGAMLLLIAFATKKAGYGDGIVLCCVGMVLRGGRSFLLFAVSLFLISFCSLALLAFRKVRRDTGMPYLPFLTAAWLIILMVEPL